MNKSSLDLTFVRAKCINKDSWIHGRYVYLDPLGIFILTESTLYVLNLTAAISILISMKLIQILLEDSQDSWMLMISESLRVTS